MNWGIVKCHGIYEIRNAVIYGVSSVIDNIPDNENISKINISGDNGNYLCLCGNLSFGHIINFKSVFRDFFKSFLNGKIFYLEEGGINVMLFECTYEDLVMKLLQRPDLLYYDLSTMS